MPRSLADGKVKLTVLEALPTDPKAAAATEFAPGQDAQCNILKSDFRLSPTASDTVSEAALCEEGNATAFGASNYEGHMTVFRYFDETGAVDPEADWLFDLVREKGAELVLALRENGKPHDAPWVAGDEYEIYVVTNDNPQRPTETSGYIKKPTPLAVARRYTGVVAA